MAASGGGGENQRNDGGGSWRGGRKAASQPKAKPAGLENRWRRVWLLLSKPLCLFSSSLDS
jgi:hypothetical protein